MYVCLPTYLSTPVPAWPGYAHDRISHSPDCYVWPFAEITEKTLGCHDPFATYFGLAATMRINWLSWYKNAVPGEQLSLYSLEYEFFGLRAISRSTS